MNASSNFLQVTSVQFMCCEQTLTATPNTNLRHAIVISWGHVSRQGANVGSRAAAAEATSARRRCVAIPITTSASSRSRHAHICPWLRFRVTA